MVAIVSFAVTGWASVPDWLRAVAHDPLPAYKADTDGVVLLHEEVTTVDNNGEIHTIYREAYKILRPNARESLSRVMVWFDNETKLTYLKGWSITASGQEYAVKEKDAVEMNAAYSEFVTDAKIKVLMIPGGEVGSVIGYEYQQRRRPSVYEDVWAFQRDLPVRTSRYTLRLPAGWEVETHWSNHDEIKPAQSGGDSTWEAKDIAAVEEEDYMPPHRAVAGRMQLHFFGPGHSNSANDWKRVGDWYGELVRDRRDSSPELKKQVADLTSDSKTTMDKVAVLAQWVQKNIRYVAVEVGIGGFQPHAASEVYRQRFGDCKDKVTLLSAMLKEIGVNSDYLLIHTVRGFVRADSPSAVTFNHVVLAIELPPGTSTDGLLSTFVDSHKRTLLIFDPTDDMTPFGYLPAELQQTHALLVGANGTELIETPLLAPKTNSLTRSGKLKLQPDGSLAGEIEELRSGALGSEFRAQLLRAQESDRAKTIESLLGNNIASYQLTKAQVGSMRDVREPLFVRYNFTAPDYAKKSGNLMLLRPRVLGQKNWSIMEGNKRLYPVEYDEVSVQSDSFEIELPPGYEVDELPDPVDTVFDFGEYHSKVVESGNVLKYTRQFTIKQVIVPTNRLDDLKKFYRQIASDEKNAAVLRPKAGASGN